MTCKPSFWLTPEQGALQAAAKELTAGDVEHVLSFCPQVPIAVQELMAAALKLYSKTAVPAKALGLPEEKP